jgi:GT2 family glycosyltransferase
MVNFSMQIRDRFNLTRQALMSLATSGMDNMTVTVLDDRSEEKTRGYVEMWCRQFNAYYIRNDEPLGTGQLRNMVMEESRKHFGQGAYVAPHDNDVFFKPHWLSDLIDCYEEVWIRGFRLIAGYGHPFHQPIGYQQFIHNHPELRVYEVQAIATQSMMMRWDVWDKYGPFCDTPVDKTCQSEDVDFTNKIRNDGFKLGVVRPSLIHATALKNTFGEPGPGWEYVKKECPSGVICE